MSETITEWLLIIPQVPSSPSSLRVSVWRRMRSAGAVNLHGVWVLPRTSNHEIAVRDLADQLEQQGGNCLFFVSRASDDAVDDTIRTLFQADRQAEYDEFSERCCDFLTEIDKETHQQKFTFAELEENEEDLRKLERWLEKIQARDFSSKGAGAATSALHNCREALQRFAHSVYKREGVNDPGAQSVDKNDEGESQ